MPSPHSFLQTVAGDYATPAALAGKRDWAVIFSFVSAKLRNISGLPASIGNKAQRIIDEGGIQDATAARAGVYGGTVAFHYRHFSAIPAHGEPLAGSAAGCGPDSAPPSGGPSRRDFGASQTSAAPGVVCPACAGTGQHAHFLPKGCSACCGTGHVP